MNWFTEGVSERHFLIKWGLKSLSQLNLVNAFIKILNSKNFKFSKNLKLLLVGNDDENLKPRILNILKSAGFAEAVHFSGGEYLFVGCHLFDDQIVRALLLPTLE